MAIDASFERVEKVFPHPNADRLDIAIVSGYQVVCGKGEIKADDVVFYIRDDAKLVEYDNFRKNGDKDGFEWKYPWQEPLVKYLGGGGRVKTIKLRGEYSSGIIVTLDKLYAKFKQDSGKDWRKDDEILRGEYPGSFLLGKYGVGHWTAPLPSIGSNDARGALPMGIPKSDEENYQNIRECEIPYGVEVLVTKKLDGASTTVLCCPNGDYHVCSRSNDLMLDCDNVWIRCAKKVVPLGLAWAKKYGKSIALRGECVAPILQKFSFNHDKDVDEPTFNLYGIIIPEAKDFSEKNGVYGTPYHFLEVNKQIKEITGEEIKTVPVIGTAVLTKELLQEYRDKPLEFGEGVVINAPCHRNSVEMKLDNGETVVREVNCWTHFKCKSLAYLEALSKQCSK